MLDSIHRRAFLRDTIALAAGAAGAAFAGEAIWPSRGAHADERNVSSGAERRLQELGLELPPPPEPVAVYVPAVRVDDLLYVSGHGPAANDGVLLRGKVGEQLTLQEGYHAARLVGRNVLSTVRATVESLDNVVRLVKVLGMVNCTPEFGQQPQVINGFSELMVQVFGEKAGKAARSAVGVGSLPGNIPVEIEAIFEVR